MSKIRFRPFSNGSQFTDWEGSNCERCTKSALNDDSWAINCTLLNALFTAQIEDGSIDEATARRLGYLTDEGEDRRYVWQCGEVEWSREWLDTWARRRGHADFAAYEVSKAVGP
jgi:hypothetical protein